MFILNTLTRLRLDSLKLFFTTLTKMVAGGELILKEAKLAEESLNSDGDGLLALEDLVGLMEEGGEEKLHDLREAFSLDQIYNPITKNSSESDQSLLAHPPSTNSQDISVSVNETPNSAMSNGTAKLSMPSSSEESLVTADDRLVEKSLDSDQFFMVLPKRKSQDISISVSETSNSSSNETDKVSNPPYSTESPVIVDNPIAKNNMDSDQSLTAPPVTKSQDIVSEENSYDCQAWRGSDSDDDFFSVRNDYSNASSRQSGMKGSPQPDEISDSKREPYPTKGGKKFVDLVYDRNSTPPAIQERKQRKSKQEASPIDENKRLAELLQDPSWSDHKSSTTVLKETKLVEFFQDSHWSQEIACTRATRFPSTKGDGKLRADVEAKHLSPRDGTSTVTTPRSRARYVSGNLKRENIARDTYCCFPSWSPIRGSQGEEKACPS
ncbi:hypothetical protein D5086_023541 [Populus alba]|uniref:Uncharacterized protein n=1 Tax=Populus alba TaxID=43335 RepID=A0ACC4BAQ8_POPAL